MAEVETVVRALPRGVAHVIGGLGILRLLRHWPAHHAPGGRASAGPAATDPVAPEPLGPTLVATAEPAHRRAAAQALERTLAEWRAAERDLDGMVMDSLDWTRTEMEVEGLRALYHRLFIQLRRSL